jgi:hypothetical protein
VAPAQPLAVLDTLGDIGLGLSPWVPRGGAYALDALGPADLEEAIGGHVLGARLESVDRVPVSQGTTDRVRLLLTWNEAGRDAGLPATAFAKGTPASPTSRVLLSAFGLAAYETGFYNDVHPTVADLTMRPYLARGRRGGRYVTVLEDLGSRPGIHFYASGDEPPLQHSRALMRTLGTLHGRFWLSPRFDADLSWIQVFSRRPGHPFAHPVVRMLTRKLFGQDRDIPPSTRRATEFFVANRPALDRAWEALPYTLVHGDCHMGNTYAVADVGNDGRAGLYDWQNIHRMNGLRDVAYYTIQALSPESRRAHEHELLEIYLDALAENGAGHQAPGYAEAFDTYRMLAFDGWLAAYTTLAIGGLQDDAAMETCFARCATAIDDLDTEQALRAAV